MDFPREFPVSTRLTLPWFLPLAALVAYATTREALRFDWTEGKQAGQALLLLTLGWYPALAWGLAQLLHQTQR